MKRLLWLSIPSLLLVGCAANLSLVPEPVKDLSVPAATKTQVSAIIVLPPRGSERGQRSELAEVEKVLLAKGFRVISSGITGRVASGPAGSRADDVSRLSDLERALILARDSNADALLQVGEIGFAPAERYFILVEGDRERFAEVPEPPSSLDAYQVRIKESRFTFQAKLINVENGEIVVSMDFSQGTSRVEPPLDIRVQLGRDEIIATIDTPERQRKAVKQVMEAFSSHISTAPSQAQPKK
jgi:hypothetical protein